MRWATLFPQPPLLAGGGALAAAGALAATPAQARPSRPARSDRSAAMPLRFRRDGRFRIVQFNDTQGGAYTDRRTIEFMGKVLDQEEPDFALINGDVIDGSPALDLEVRQALNNVVLPMESRGIPWAVTFGNHDEDSVEEHGTSMTEPRMLEFLRSYRHNLNTPIDRSMPGESNSQLLVRGSRGAAPASATEAGADACPGEEWA